MKCDWFYIVTCGLMLIAGFSTWCWLGGLHPCH